MFDMERLLEVLVSVLIIIVLAVAIFPTSFKIQDLILPKEKLPQFLSVTTTTIIEETPSTPEISSREVLMYVPAVDDNGNGTALEISVQARPGEGRVLTDINNLFFWVDTQNSIRVAERVAQNITKADISKIDLIYNVKTNASVIEGPSAGAALTIATIAALENKDVNHDVMITGTINPDGTIGPVGGVDAKAQAAKDIGVKTFLVPAGQSIQRTYKPTQVCETNGFIQYCSTEYTAKVVNITKVSGIEVKEVTNIQEALKYFLK